MNKALIENPEFDRWIKARTPAGRWASLRSWSGPPYSFPATHRNFVTGQIVYVDGGCLQRCDITKS